MNEITPSQRSLTRIFSRKLPKYFSGDEIKKIITEELKLKKYKAYILCLLLWHTGARVGEAVNIKVEDIDFSGKVIKIKTLKRKGHVRVIPLQPQLLGELAIYINHYELKRDDRLFNVSTRTAYNWVTLACNAAGINDERAHPHTFRHSFAINCLIQGTPITVLQDWLGHRDIAKTLIYTKILAHDTRKFMDDLKF
jgi:integrase